MEIGSLHGTKPLINLKLFIDRSLRVWDVHTLKEVRVLQGNIDMKSQALITNNLQDIVEELLAW